MSRPEAAPLAEHTHAERERLADLFTDLEPELWDHASLCEGWRVREVVAHMTMPFRTKPPAFFTGMVRARFSFDRYADRDARRTAAARGERELVELIRANITHPWSPPGGGPAGALSHDVIHGLDVTEPLGLAAPPTDRIAAVLAGTSARQITYFGADLGGRRLVANDADVSVGDGSIEVELPAKEILLVVTGRRSVDEVTR